MSTQVQYETVPARILAFVDCPNCGRISKPESQIMVVLRNDSPNRIHCHFKCERCGTGKALRYLEREVLSRH